MKMFCPWRNAMTTKVSLVGVLAVFGVILFFAMFYATGHNKYFAMAAFVVYTLPAGLVVTKAFKDLDSLDTEYHSGLYL